MFGKQWFSYSMQTAESVSEYGERQIADHGWCIKLQEGNGTSAKPLKSKIFVGGEI
jgi:hypothetical protein